jgi:hypothetical protein
VSLSDLAGHGSEMTTNGETLDDAYLTWLYGLVSSVENRNPAHGHRNLFKQMYETSFEGWVPNDDNRAADGKDLRIIFLQSTGYPLDDPQGQWFDLGCSILEMIIALAAKVSYEDMDEAPPVAWFWRMVHNLGLDGYTDDIFEISIQEEVAEVLDRFNSRKYEYNGQGGLFPLREPREDQRTVELWTQMSAYLLEGMYKDEKPGW